MPTRKVDYAGITINVDFSDDEIERRATEIVLRCCGKHPTFNLETGQPLEGEQLSQAELRRRGYLDGPEEA